MTWGHGGVQTGHPHPLGGNEGQRRGPAAGQVPQAAPAPTSFLLSAEELSSLDTNSLLLKLSLAPLAEDLVEDDDLEAAPFFSAFPFICFSCFFFFFLDLSLRDGKGVEQRGVTPLAPAPALPAAPHTHALELSDLLPTPYSFMAFS